MLPHVSHSLLEPSHINLRFELPSLLRSGLRIIGLVFVCGR